MEKYTYQSVTGSCEPDKQTYIYETDMEALTASNEFVKLKVTLETDNEIVGMRLKKVLDNDAAMMILNNVNKVYLEKQVTV
jgi:hypothetical protein